MRGHVCVGIAMIVTLAASAVAHGQARPRAQRPRFATLRTDATVQGLRPGVLLVKTEDGQQWAISVPRQPEALEYHGEATASWLQRGMVVRFHALLNKRGRAQEDITSVSVITLRRGIEPGIVPDQGPADGGEVSTVPMIAGAKKKRKRTGRSVSAFPVLVIGRLLGIKKRSMTVAAGRTVIEAPLAEKVQVTVDANDYRLARPGDKVEIDARYPPQRRGFAEGQRLVITAAQPLSPPTKVARRHGRQRKSTVHESDGEK